MLMLFVFFIRLHSLFRFTIHFESVRISCLLADFIDHFNLEPIRTKELFRKDHCKSIKHRTLKMVRKPKHKSNLQRHFDYHIHHMLNFMSAHTKKSNFRRSSDIFLFFSNFIIRQIKLPNTKWIYFYEVNNQRNRVYLVQLNSL